MKRILYIILFAGGLILGHFPLQAQYGKVYFRPDLHEIPTTFSAQVLERIPGTEQFFLAGSLKESAPNLTARGFVLRLDERFEAQMRTALLVQSNHAFETIELVGGAVDKQQNLYLAGALMQNPQGGGFNSERTLTSLDKLGKERWTAMQANYTYVDVLLEPTSQDLIAVAGPDGYTPLADISLQRYDQTGQLTRYASLQTNTEDRALAVFTLPTSGDFIVVGRADSGSAQKPLVARFDSEFTLKWAHVYDMNNARVEVTSAALHPEGIIGIGGTAYNGSGPQEGFILQIDPEGEVLRLDQFTESTGRHLAPSGLTAIHHPSSGTNGFALVGAHHEAGATQIRRAFGFYANINAQVRWAWNYSDLPLKEYVADEIATVAEYFTGTNVLALGGNYLEYLPGQPVADRRIWAAKVRATDGRLPAKGSNGCATEMEVLSVQSSSGYQTVGTVQYGGSASPAAYGSDNPVLPPTFCSYADAFVPGGQLVPKGDAVLIKPRQLRLRYAADQVDQAELIDIWGRTVARTGLGYGTSQYDWALPQLAGGMYILRLSQGHQLQSIQKVRVQP